MTAEAGMLAALDASERRFRARFEQIPIPQAMLTADGRLTSANDALCTLLGRDREHLEGTALTTYLHATDPTDVTRGWPDLLACCRATGGCECALDDADGREVPVLVHAAVLTGPGGNTSLTGASLTDSGGVTDGVAVVVQDLSSLRGAQRKVGRQGAMLTALARCASESAVVLDATGAIQYLSSAAAEVGKLDPAEVAGTGIWDRVHRDDLRAVRQAFDAVVADAEVAATVEFRAGDGTGAYRWIEAAYTNRLADPDITGVICVYRDVTQRVHDARALRESEARYRAIAETAQEGIWSLHLTGQTSYANQKTADIFGIALNAMYERTVGEMLDASGVERIAGRLRDGRPRGSEQFEVSYRHPDAAVRTLRLNVSDLHDECGHTGLLAMISDVTEERHAEERLRRRTLHDDLTGLPNRTLLGDRLHHAVARRGNGSVAMLFVNLDHFKMINESRGHSAGDALLVLVAARLSAAVRPEDTVAHFGGDKFTIVCEGTTEPRACALAGRLQDALADPFDVEGQRVYLTASVGVAVSPPNPATELLRYAETAMYAAKSLGPGRVTAFDQTQADDAAQRLVLTNDLRHALRHDELTLSYQPIVDLADGRVLGCEALARWQHPVRGAISPMTFVGIAEATGQAPALDRWALTRACREAAQFVDMLAAPPRVSVNISARHLTHPDLEKTVFAALAGSPLAGGGLILEITETAVMDNPIQARELLKRLKDIGVETAIDDFGTGYSSLAYLSRLPVSTLKIDRSFVSDITVNPDSLAITASVVKLAATMGLRVVAEGIETVEQLGLLRRLGCAAGQGYLFSPGIPPDAFVDLLSRLPDGRFDVTVSPNASLDQHGGTVSALPLPATAAGIERAAMRATHEATRALLYAVSPREVVDVVIGLVRALGAVVMPARRADLNALPLDLSFGADEPLLPAAEPGSLARLHVETLLPSFLDDARQVVMGLRHTVQLRSEATCDPLTGLLNRRALDRQLHRLGSGDAVAMIDLDHFKRLNDTVGHAAGDAVLAAFGQLIRDHLRTDDLVARYGGEEVVIAMFGASPQSLQDRLEQVRRTWAIVRPYPITFSAGVAAVVTTADAALRSADEAMYAAKRAGRDRTEALA